jgi:hypothetical protein
MDLATVEQAYHQLQQEDQGVMEALQTLVSKLKTAADGGNQDAREWLLDLKKLALNIQNEQQQVMVVMQTMHRAVQNDVAAMQPGSGGRRWQPGYPQTPRVGQPQGYSQQQGGGLHPAQGFLNSLEHSEFGQMLKLGAGFGIGDALINRLF